MRKLTTVLAACAALALNPGCGGGDGDGDAPGPVPGDGTGDPGGGVGGGGGDFATVLQATWRGCFAGNPDRDNTYTFGTTSVAWRFTDLSTFDGSCGGTGTAWPVNGTYALGATVAVPFGSGGPTVAARKIDLNYGYAGTEFDIAYIDTSVAPARLYFGDVATGGKTSNANRPTRLNTSEVLTRQ